MPGATLVHDRFRSVDVRESPRRAVMVNATPADDIVGAALLLIADRPDGMIGPGNPTERK
jgi:hypothetical protein